MSPALRHFPDNPTESSYLSSLNHIVYDNLILFSLLNMGLRGWLRIICLPPLDSEEKASHSSCSQVHPAHRTGREIETRLKISAEPVSDYTDTDGHLHARSLKMVL